MTSSTTSPSTASATSSTSATSATSTSATTSFHAHRNALHLATAFCFVFTAFSVAQNSQTSDLGSDGTIGLSILYGTFTISNTFSAWVVRAMGVRHTLVFGAMTYTLYVVANVYVIAELLFISSALIGLGAALLWTAQGMYISNCATVYEYQNSLPSASTTGTFNGTFWSIFQLSQFTGSLLAALLYQFETPSWIVFLCMSVIGGLGATSLLFLDDPSEDLARYERERRVMAAVPDADLDPRISLIVEDGGAGGGGGGGGGGSRSGKTTPGHVQDGHSPQTPLLGASDVSDLSNDSADADRAPARSSQLATILASLALLRDPRLLFLLPIIIYSGLSQSFIFGVFPPLIAAKNDKFYALAVFGAVDAVASMLMGKASDRVGRVPILNIGLAAHAAVYVYLMLVDTSDAPFYVFATLAVGLGIGDAAFNTQVYAILSTFFEKQSEHAFANFKLFQSGSSTVSYVVQLFVSSTRTRSIVPLASLALGMLCVLLCDWFHQPVSASRNAAAANSASADIAYDGKTVDDGVIASSSSPLSSSMGSGDAAEVRNRRREANKAR